LERWGIWNTFRISKYVCACKSICKTTHMLFVPYYV
jgi:hypothetical protein